MYNEKIEALIKAALTDGVLTEKEKQILFKRAQAEGIDLDEFEMVLDAKLVELQKAEKDKATKSAPKSDKFGDVRKCPACGAIISSGIAVCKECGYAFTEAVSTAAREKLNQVLAEIENSFETTTSYLGIKQDDPSKLQKMAKLKADTIKRFNVPNTKADLLDFLSYLAVLANPSANKDGWAAFSMREDLGYAYWQLFATCVNKAKISFANDSSFIPYYEKQEAFYKVSKKFHLSQVPPMHWLFGFCVVFLVIVSLLVHFGILE